MERLALTIAEAARLGGPCRSALYEDIRAGRLSAETAGMSVSGANRKCACAGKGSLPREEFQTIKSAIVFKMRVKRAQLFGLHPDRLTPA